MFHAKPHYGPLPNSYLPPLETTALPFPAVSLQTELNLSYFHNNRKGPPDRLALNAI